MPKTKMKRDRSRRYYEDDDRAFVLVEQADNSYFGECERDGRGRCLPGNGGEDETREDSVEGDHGIQFEPVKKAK